MRLREMGRWQSVTKRSTVLAAAAASPWENDRKHLRTIHPGLGLHHSYGRLLFETDLSIDRGSDFYFRDSERAGFQRSRFFSWLVNVLQQTNRTVQKHNLAVNVRCQLSYPSTLT